MPRWAGAARSLGEQVIVKQCQKADFNPWPDLSPRSREQFHRSGKILYRCVDPAERLYRLVYGHVKLSRYLSDGRVQILRFCDPGDFFGLPQGRHPDHGCEAEGVTEVLVQSIAYAEVEQAGDRDVRVERWFTGLVTEELTRSRALLMMLGHFRAEERLDYFLRHEAHRTPGGEIHLPMLMSDLAIYLALRHETLSRVITQMTQRRVLRRLPNKRFVYRPEPVRQATG